MLPLGECIHHTIARHILTTKIHKNAYSSIGIHMLLECVKVATSHLIGTEGIEVALQYGINGHRDEVVDEERWNGVRCDITNPCMYTLGNLLAPAVRRHANNTSRSHAHVQPLSGLNDPLSLAVTTALGNALTHLAILWKHI